MQPQSDKATALEDYPVVIQLPVMWGQMDAFQHVNNIVYFRYFESARIVYGDRIGLYTVMEETGIGPILGATECRFLKPLRYPDTIDVGCRTTKLTPSVMEQEYAIHSRKSARVVAVGTAKIVAYDYRQLRKSRFPERLVDEVTTLEKHLIFETSP